MTEAHEVPISPDVSGVLRLLGAAGEQSPLALKVASELIEALPLPVYFKGRDGRYLGVNREWERLFGVSRDVAYGKQEADLCRNDRALVDVHRAVDEQLWKQPGRHSYEVALIGADGLVRHTIYHKATFVDARGQVGGMVGTIVDITARKKTEEDLRRFRLALDSSGDIVVLIDRATMRFIDVNDTACRLLGYSREELRRIGPHDILPASRDELERAYDALIADPSAPSGMQSYYRRKDGTRLYFEAVRRVLRSGDKWIVVAISRDIGARMAVEKALRESEARFRSLTELSADWIFEFDEHYRFRPVGLNSVDKPSQRPPDYIGKRPWELAGSNLDETQWARFRGMLDSRQEFRNFEYCRLSADGVRRWVSVSGAPLYDEAGRFEGYRGVASDITERKHAEGELLRFRLAIDMSLDSIYLTDPVAMRFVDVNAVACRRLGYTREQLLAMSPHEVLGVDQGRLKKEYARIIEVGERGTSRESSFVRHDGSTGWTELHNRALRLNDNWLIISIGREITERKQAELLLRESEERYRRTFDLAGSGIAHVDMKGRWLRVNRSLCALLGYSSEELSALSVKDISHPEDRDITDAQRRRMHEGQVDSVRFEKRYVRKDGSTVWVDLTVALVRDADGNPQYEIAMMDDITSRKEAEAALRAAHDDLRRSNAELEQFAYVASHDLQEPLRMVSSYTQLLERRYGDRLEGDAKEFMGYVVDGAARMRRLIEDLLAYSRVGTRGREFQRVAGEDLLYRALGNLGAALEESRGTVTHEPLPMLEVDDVQIVQLLQNLIGNALKFRGAEPPSVSVAVREHSSEWEFVVRDNGIGIEPQYFERIFLMFQRLHNKADYSGTGIGLAICKKVVERHGGRIWVESSLGAGAAFHFTLPKSRSVSHA